MQFQSAGTICSLLSIIFLQQRLINITLGNTSVFRCKLHGVFSGIPLLFFCQFPAKSHTAVAKCLPELAKRPYKPVRSFIEDYSSRFIGKLLQDDFSLFLICRKKSFESEPSGVQT